MELSSRGLLLCSHSRSSQTCMEPEGSLPHSQEPFIGPCRILSSPHYPHLICRRFILILSTRLHLCLSSGLSILLAFLPVTYTRSSSPPFMLHATSISFSLTWSFYLHLAKSTSCEAPHYAFSPPSHHVIPLQSKYSQTHSVCGPPLMSETTTTEPQAKW
jgi:hypothetical protein